MAQMKPEPPEEWFHFQQRWWWLLNLQLYNVSQNVKKHMHIHKHKVKIRSILTWNDVAVSVATSVFDSFRFMQTIFMSSSAVSCLQMLAKIRNKKKTRWDSQTWASLQWWSGRSMNTHIVLGLRSLIWGFGESCKIVHCITSLPTKRCSNDIFVNLQPAGSNLKAGLFDSLVWQLGGRRGLGMGPFDSSPMGSYWFYTDTYGLPLTIFDLFSWLKKRFRPPDLDTMTNTAL